MKSTLWGLKMKKVSGAVLGGLVLLMLCAILAYSFRSHGGKPPAPDEPQTPRMTLREFVTPLCRDGWRLTLYRDGKKLEQCDMQFWEEDHLLYGRVTGEKRKYKLWLDSGTEELTEPSRFLSVSGNLFLFSFQNQTAVGHWGVKDKRLAVLQGPLLPGIEPPAWAKRDFAKLAAHPWQLFVNGGNRGTMLLMVDGEKLEGKLRKGDSAMLFKGLQTGDAMLFTLDNQGGMLIFDPVKPGAWGFLENPDGGRSFVKLLPTEN